VKLYSYWRSSSAWRVRIALAYKGLDYQYVAVDIQPGHDAQKAPDFGVINAMRQVPVLEIEMEPARGSGLLRLGQSVAIVELLEELYPSPALLPQDPLDRARVREIVEIIASGVQPLQNLSITAELRRLGGDGAATAFARQAIASGLEAVEARVRERGQGYCVGAEPSLADAFLLPQLYNARRYGVELSGLGTLLAVEERASARPDFAAAHPDRQPDAPSAGTERS